MGGGKAMGLMEVEENDLEGLRESYSMVTLQCSLEYRLSSSSSSRRRSKDGSILLFSILQCEQLEPVRLIIHVPCIFLHRDRFLSSFYQTKYSTIQQ